MCDSPTPEHRDYFAALDDEQEALDDALACIRAETTAGRLSPAGAAAERAQLLEQHIARLAALRARYLGES